MSTDNRAGEIWATVALLICLAVVMVARNVPGTFSAQLDTVWVDWVVQNQADAAADTSAVTVVVLSDEDLVELGERWPIRRSTWAHFIRSASAFDPRVIALDAWFESREPSGEVDLALEVAEKIELTGLIEHPMGGRVADWLDRRADALDGDLQIARAFAESSRVVVGVACVPTGEGKPTVAGLEPLQTAFVPQASCPSLSGNLPSIADAARAAAVLDVLHDPDGVVRRYSYLWTIAGRSYPSLAFRALQSGAPERWQQVKDRPRAWDRGSPVLRAMPPSSFDTVHFSDILRAQPDDPIIGPLLKDRFVFVGVSARGTRDFVHTPIGGLGMPGVYLHANALVDLLGNRVLLSEGSVAWAGGFGGFALFGLLSLVGHRLRTAPPLMAAGVATAGSWTVVGYFSATQGLLIPVMPVVAATAVWVGLRLGFAWRTVERARREAHTQRLLLLDKLQVRNQELQESLDTLRRTRLAKEKMESEVAVAKDIQMSMLPDVDDPFPTRPEISLAAVLEPARGVGGDFFDFFLIDDDRLCFTVGDVSGKGVPAALFMAMTQTLFRAHTTSERSTAEVAGRVNDELSNNNDACMFATVFVGVLNLRTGDLDYTNGGHNPPYIVRADGTLEIVDDRHGPMVGPMEGVIWKQSRRVLATGDRLFVFTDGITEAMDIDNQLLGEPRLEAVLAGNTASSAAQLLDLVHKLVIEHQGAADQSDDITILAMGFHGTEA